MNPIVKKRMRLVRVNFSREIARVPDGDKLYSEEKSL
jgi:hypothetical protein